jgi:hypothetical protein
MYEKVFDYYLLIPNPQNNMTFSCASSLIFCIKKQCKEPKLVA